MQSHDTTAQTPTLAQMGLTKDESSRYQKLASMPAEHFETAVATAKEAAGQVTTAFMLREAKKLAAPVPHVEQQAAKERAERSAGNGKRYSATMNLSPALLSQVRERFQDVEPAFRAATGYGFDALTESEARYLANFKPAQSVRDRILAAGNEAGDGLGQDSTGGARFSLTRPLRGTEEQARH